jgi:class 3 adenylate cyclase
VRSGGGHIAYQVVGEGALDLVCVPAFMSNIELAWGGLGMGGFLEGLLAIGRVIQFDRRGNGMSDAAAGPAPLEDQLDDVTAVLEETASSDPVLISFNEGCALAALYAATYPDRVRALVLLTPQARLVASPGYEWALSREERAAMIDTVVAFWGQEGVENPWLRFHGSGPHERRMMARYQRLAMGPGDARAAMELAGETDVRGALPSIQCPTLVLRRQEDAFIDERHCRYVADHIPCTRYVQLPGEGPVWLDEGGDAAREIASFLTGVSPPPAPERVLATVLFTDVVASTETAARVGDDRWRTMLARHDALLRSEVQRHRGRLVKSLGDGALALFDGPSRAIGCALSVRDAVSELGLEIRAGLHTGECELLSDADVGGIAVHIGARVAALAGAGEVLVTSTVRDLSVGSPFRLESRGEQLLKGVPEPWRLYAAQDGSR